MGTSVWNPPYPVILGHEMVGFVRGDRVEAPGVILGGGRRPNRRRAVPFMRMVNSAPRATISFVEQARLRHERFLHDTAPPLRRIRPAPLCLLGPKVHKIRPDVPPEAAHLASVVKRHPLGRAKRQVQFLESVVIVSPGAQDSRGVISAVDRHRADSGGWTRQGSQTAWSALQSWRHHYAWSL